MADFYRTSGNVTPGGMGTFVSFMGKQPTCYGIKVAGTAGAKDVSAELGPNDAVAGILKAISANATILAYQIENNSTGNISLMLEAPVEFTATNIRDIIRNSGNGAGGYGNSSPLFDAGQTLVTNVGFKLAYS
jgi:hypothetical protein